jgi:murein DD-endopeptidase MepM/ murein hydrolase activator NlpD
MLSLVLKGLLGLALIGSGWIAGSLYPAPERWTAIIRGQAEPLLAELDLSPEGLARLRQSLSPDDFERLGDEAARLAASTGDAIRVERTPGAILEEHADITEAAPVITASGYGVFEDDLRLCPGMSVSNAPRAGADNKVEGYARVIDVNGVAIAANPTHGACLSSGVGRRGNRTHKGLDLFSQVGGPVFTAADGVVIEKLYRDDYGNMLLIDHGGGVYTRYAHLSSFAADLSVGARVTAGQQIGLMGNTASYPIPVHLHYELLLGDYANPRGSFGLTPRSPFDFASIPIEPMQATRDASASGVCSEGRITAPTIVTIRRGDTIATIAQSCYGGVDAWRQVARCNSFLNERNRGGVSPLNGGDLLYVGDRLMLPAPDGACPSQ